MSLTYEQKQEYVNAINAIWQGSMQNNNVNAISDEVVENMDIVLTQIQQGTKAFLAADIIFGIFYLPASSWPEIFLMIAQNIVSGSVSGWISVIRGNSRYKAVVDATALNFKSSVQLALYGI